MQYRNKTDQIPPYPETLAALFQAHPESAFDYLEFRLVIARMAARQAAERSTEEDRARLTSAYESLRQAHDRYDLDSESQADTKFHLAIYQACHNAVMGFIMSTLITMQSRDVFYDRRRIHQQPGAREAMMDQHRALYLAILNRRPEAAAEAAEIHIRFTNHSLRESIEAERRLQSALRRQRRSLSQEDEE